MASPPPPELILYARQGCGLCDETRVTLTRLLDQRAAEGRPVARLVERDIDEDPALELAFFDRIPVIEFQGRLTEMAIGPSKLRRILAEGLDR